MSIVFWFDLKHKVADVCSRANTGLWTMAVLSVWRQQLGDTLLSCKAEDCCRFHWRLVAFVGPVTFGAYKHLVAQNQTTIAILT